MWNNRFSQWINQSFGAISFSFFSLWCWSKALMSFAHREFGFLQRKPRLQLCIQQQFSGCSHPSAFYSHDHRRLCSVPLQTQVRLNPLHSWACLTLVTCIQSLLWFFLLPFQSKFPGFWWQSAMIALKRYICITLSRYDCLRSAEVWSVDLRMRSSSGI